MDPYVVDWLNLVIRWAHFVFGAAWIGTSFYFVWLNNTIRPPVPPREGVEGELWAIHGGGFYRISKHDPRMPSLPDPLHWFKYEAYFTWITGFLLMVIIYWLGAEVYLVAESKVGLTAGQGIAVSAGSLVAAWVVYDLLCKSPLKTRPRMFGAVGFAAIALSAWGLTQLLGPRAAYLHVGAMLGTCMAWNVFFIIIPGQKAMVAATLAGQAVDVGYGKRAALRSLHNNYLTLPVLFVMISNHFPMTYGHPSSWLVLVALFGIGAGVKHYFNLHAQGTHARWVLPASALALIALAFVMRPDTRQVGMEELHSPPSFAEVQVVIAQRCQPCHSQTPTHPAFPEAPLGALLDTEDQVRALADKIKVQAVDTRIMPLGNLTQMTEEERALLGRWVRAQ